MVTCGEHPKKAPKVLTHIHIIRRHWINAWVLAFFKFWIAETCFEKPFSCHLADWLLSLRQVLPGWCFCSWRYFAPCQPNAVSFLAFPAGSIDWQLRYVMLAGSHPHEGNTPSHSWWDWGPGCFTIMSWCPTQEVLGVCESSRNFNFVSMASM